MKNTIRLIANESGDWEVLLLNGEIYKEGHDISTRTWLNLIRKLGHGTSIEEVTDEEMANDLY